MFNIRPRTWSNKREDCKEGAPGLMANLYLYKITEHESVSQGANGLQPIHLKEVSTVPGCIHGF